MMHPWKSFISFVRVCIGNSFLYRNSHSSYMAFIWYFLMVNYWFSIISNAIVLNAYMWNSSSIFPLIFAMCS